MPDNERVPILKQSIDFIRFLGKGGIFFKLAVLIGQNEPLFAFAIGQVKTALGVDQNIFLFKDITSPLIQKFIEKKVAVVPGAAFMCDTTATSPCFRLNYSTPSDEQIVEGIRRLGEAFENL